MRHFLINLVLAAGILLPSAAVAQVTQNPREISEEGYQRFRAGDKMGASQIFGQICDQGNGGACEFEAVAVYSAVVDLFGATSGTNANGVQSNCSDLLNMDKQCAGPVGRAAEMLRPVCLKGSRRGAAAVGPQVRRVCGTWVQQAKHLRLIEDPEGALGLRGAPSEDASADDSSPDDPAPARASASAPAPAQASSGPTLLVRASLGTGCVSAKLTDVRHLPTGWEGVWVLQNNCNTQQIVAIEGGGGIAVSGWPAVWNIGAWPPALPKRPPPLPFTPVQMMTDGTHYLLDANASNTTFSEPLSWHDGDPPFEVWIASCAAYAPGGAKQVMYRSASQLSASPKIACAPAY